MATCDGLYYYSSANLFFGDRSRMDQLIAHDQHGLRLFRDTFMGWGGKANVCWHDRSLSITTPFRMVTMPGMELPRYRKIDQSLEQICHDRAMDLLAKAEAADKQLLVMYSGGIDSTLMLVSLMKAASPTQLRRRVVVLLNRQSRHENPSFYRDHIISKCSMEHSQFFHRYLGDDRYITLTGEFNDHLWGSQQLVDSSHIFTEQPWDLAMSSELVVRWLCERYDTVTAERIYTVLAQVGNACPFSLDSVYAWYWWIVFTCKWQQTFWRGAAFAHAEQRDKLVPEQNYTAFYSTETFQLWHMNHRHELRDDKWLCKDIIYDFNGDRDYRDRKTKQGSLGWLLQKKPSATAIDSDLAWHDSWNNDAWLNPDNSWSRA